MIATELENYSRFTANFPFRARLPGEDRTQRHISSAKHIAKYWHLPAEQVVVDALPGMHCVSAKRNEDYGDLYLYVLEFCSVMFKKETDEIRELRSKSGDPWFDLNTLRADGDLRKRNGDLIRALHELLTVNLGSLPNSFPKS